MFKGDLNEASVKVLSAQEVDTWIKDSPWKTRDLPCEIKNILAPGNVDPSPVALDISGSAPKAGTRLVYIPVRSKVDCPSPKSDFFLDDVAGMQERRAGFRLRGWSRQELHVFLHVGLLCLGQALRRLPVTRVFVEPP